MKIGKSIRAVCILYLFLAVGTSGFAQDVPADVQSKITAQMALLREAHLNSNPQLAENLYHPKLILTSQSGKTYTRELALSNLKNAFEFYESSDIRFIQVAKDVVLTSYLNERKYVNFDKGTFRLTAIWKLENGQWQIISMQSSRIKKPE